MSAIWTNRRPSPRDSAIKLGCPRRGAPHLAHGVGSVHRSEGFACRTIDPHDGIRIEHGKKPSRSPVFAALRNASTTAR
jgi:hypothetical protein